MKNLLTLFLIFLLSTLPAAAQSFKQKQLRYERVRAAFTQKEEGLKKLCLEMGFSYPPKELFIRIFKREKLLEVWAREGAGKYRSLKSYPICSSSGELGPKRKRGDLQVPEGFYHINDFNPNSNFYLSLGVSYPNRSDQILKEGRDPGGAIYIHGSCVTIGCVPIEDEGIKELYALAVEATAAGQRQIPVHIFPCRLDSAGLKSLEALYGANSKLLEFWKNLALGFSWFEEKRWPPKVSVDSKGRYVFCPAR
jgi:murein L,D-transpeptidase YafK